MLTHIQISDFTIIENLDHSLAPGMSVLTGETGAGKSIIIDALNLILGGRANSQLIRPGCERSNICGVFDVSHIPQAKQWLSEHELDNDNECILRRTISRDGRSRGFINGHVVPIQQMRDLCELLVNIHGQHEHQSLTKSDKQRDMVDAFAGNQKLVAAVTKHFEAWQHCRNRIRELSGDNQDTLARSELLRYQIEELDALAIGQQEVKQLHQEQKQLASASDLIQDCQYSLNLLDEDDDSALTRIQRVQQRLAKHLDAAPALANVHDLLNNALIQGQEALAELQGYFGQLELNPERLVEVEARLVRLHDVARKHQIEPEQLHELLPRLQQEYEQLQQQDGELAQLHSQLEQHLADYAKACTKLSKARKQAASKLSKAVTANMQTLNMDGGQFIIELKAFDGEPRHYGADDIDFLVTTNPGVPAGRISKIASGGELSRISLAIQVIIAQSYKTPVLVFDEVDVGIGGGTAAIVGQLLRQLGESVQVMCITHLPQVASQAHNHVLVEKHKGKDQTVSVLRALDKQERVQEIARMLGGKTVGKQALANAQEMLVD